MKLTILTALCLTFAPVSFHAQEDDEGFRFPFKKGETETTDIYSMDDLGHYQSAGFILMLIPSGVQRTLVVTSSGGFLCEPDTMTGHFGDRLELLTIPIFYEDDEDDGPMAGLSFLHNIEKVEPLGFDYIPFRPHTARQALGFAEVVK